MTFQYIFHPMNVSRCEPSGSSSLIQVEAARLSCQIFAPLLYQPQDAAILYCRGTKSASDCISFNGQHLHTTLSRELHRLRNHQPILRLRADGCYVHQPAGCAAGLVGVPQTWTTLARVANLTSSIVAVDLTPALDFALTSTALLSFAPVGIGLARHILA